MAAEAFAWLFHRWMVSARHSWRVREGVGGLLSIWKTGAARFINKTDSVHLAQPWLECLKLWKERRRLRESLEVSEVGYVCGVQWFFTWKRPTDSLLIHSFSSACDRLPHRGQLTGVSEVFDLRAERKKYLACADQYLPDSRFNLWLFSETCGGGSDQQQNWICHPGTIYPGSHNREDRGWRLFWRRQSLAHTNGQVHTSEMTRGRYSLASRRR